MRSVAALSNVIVTFVNSIVVLVQMAIFSCAAIAFRDTVLATEAAIAHSV